MVDLDVDLLARIGLADTIEVVTAVNSTGPSVADDVQTVESQVASSNRFIDPIALWRARDKKVINATPVEISPERIPCTCCRVRGTDRHTGAVGRRVAGY